MRKIAIWKTGHEIADRVADSLAKGIPDAEIRSTAENGCNLFGRTNIAYGILRGTDKIFHASDQWFNVDRGYFNPSHYGGYYRISYRGTQARYDPAFPVTQHGWDTEPIRQYDKNKPWLMCPPTDVVKDFFHVEDWNPEAGDAKPLFRKKGDPSPIPWEEICGVITFNSSVGWQAIQRGIPCLSDTTHSVVGSYYNTNSLDELIEKFNTMPRKPLFDFMKAHQFTLSEIEQGIAWPLINHYLCSSVGILENPFVRMSQHTQYAAGLKNHFQSVI